MDIESIDDAQLAHNEKSQKGLSIGYGLLTVTVGKAWWATTGLCQIFLVLLWPLTIS